MKRLLTLALCIACATPALASVIVVVPPLSTQRPRITVLLDGKPSPRLQVAVYLSYYPHDGQDASYIDHRLLLVTGRASTIRLPLLRPGTYMLDMYAKPNFTAGMWLDITPNRRNAHYAAFVTAYDRNHGSHAVPQSSFSASFTRYTTFAQWLARQQQLPVTKLSIFQGTVCDETGAVTPHSVIEIYKVNGSKPRRIKKLKTNALGGFSARLRNGEYIATFHIAGFMTTARHILISSEASNHPLKITMSLGQVGQ